MNKNCNVDMCNKCANNGLNPWLGCENCENNDNFLDNSKYKVIPTTGEVKEI